MSAFTIILIAICALLAWGASANAKKLGEEQRRERELTESKRLARRQDRETRAALKRTTKEDAAEARAAKLRNGPAAKVWPLADRLSKRWQPW